MMRVFDFYQFNIAKRVKKKQTIPYLSKMLSDLGLSYGNLSFSLCTLISKTISDITDDYPSLFKYKYYYDQTRRPILTSMTPRWNSGEIYVEQEDRETVLEFFSKIPRVYDLNGKLVFQQINWYGESNEQTAVLDRYADVGKAVACGDKGIVSNSIIIERNIDDGYRLNTIWACIESTTDGTPKDTSDIVSKLKPYLGEPNTYRREWYFSSEQSCQYKAYEKQVLDILNKEIAKYAQLHRSLNRNQNMERSISALVEKKLISEVFDRTDFHFVSKEKGDLPGSYRLSCFDKHNYKFTVLIERSPENPTCIPFSYIISGCNFRIRSNSEFIYAATKTQAKEQLEDLAEFACYLQEKYNDYIAERFGDTPIWCYKEY